MASGIYAFGRCILIPAKRELWVGDRPVHLPRRQFDCLVLLLENRDRAVGRDELVSVLWGDAGVSDKQVNQLIVRVRRALGDDGIAQAMIGTVAGYGYRWVIDTRQLDGEEGVVPPSADLPASFTTAPTAASGRRWTTGVVLAMALLSLSVLLAVLVLVPGRRVESFAAPEPVEPTDIALVLPFEVEGGGDDAWVRLGMMELTADRFRHAGMPVPPSESILVALRDRQFESGDARDAWLKEAFGASALVRGRLFRNALGWEAELLADRNGIAYQVRTGGSDAGDATGRAVAILLGDMEISGLRESSGNAAHDRLHRAQAAVLAGQYAQARSLLESLEGQQPNDPEVLHRLADLDAREGRYEQAVARLEVAFSLPAVADDPVLSARIANLQGDLALRRQECGQALRHYDMAASTLHAFPVTKEHAAALMGRGLSHTCLHDFARAAGDIGQARLNFEAIGDRAGGHRAEQYRGLLEMERGRPADAIPYLRNAADAYARLGDIDQYIFGLTSLFDAHALQLQWEQAWEVSERGWKLRDEVRHPGQRQWLYVDRLRALVARGRLTEARLLLAEARNAGAGQEALLNQHLTVAAIELAWAEGDHAAAVALTTSLRQSGSDTFSSHDAARSFLLAQRASILRGRPEPFWEVLAAEAESPDQVARAMVPLLAKAEWLAHSNDGPEVEALYLRLISESDRLGIPATLVLTADSYAQWLVRHGRADEAGAVVGRIAAWSSGDFDSALAKLRVLHALGHRGAWSEGLAVLRQLAGERPLPAEVLSPP